jgi:hypothetical protein
MYKGTEMSGEQVPPPDLAPAIPPGTTPEQTVEMWLDLLDTCEQLVLAGLAHRAGPGADIQALYRQWLEKQMEEHDRTMLRMMERFEERTQGRAI